MWISSPLTTESDLSSCEDELWEPSAETKEASGEHDLLLKHAAFPRRDLWIALALSLLLHGLALLFAEAMSLSGVALSGQASYITVQLLGGGGEGGAGGLGQGGRKTAGKDDLPAAGSGETKNSGENREHASPPSASHPVDGQSEPAQPAEPVTDGMRLFLPSAPIGAELLSDGRFRLKEIKWAEPHAVPTGDSLEGRSSKREDCASRVPKQKRSKRSAAKRSFKDRRPPHPIKEPKALPAALLECPVVPGGQRLVQGGNGAKGSSAGNGMGAEGGSGVGGEDGTGVAAGGPGKMGGAFSLKQVDRPPKLLRGGNPKYPKTAHDMHITGRVVVKFLVMPDGHVCHAKVLESSPQGVFDQSVLESVGKWEFRPGYYHHKAVATWVIVPVSFKLTRE